MIRTDNRAMRGGKKKGKKSQSLSLTFWVRSSTSSSREAGSLLLMASSERDDRRLLGLVPFEVNICLACPLAEIHLNWLLLQLL